MEDRLDKFREVVEHGSFTEAATALHISQPALTMAVNKLERELGAKLMHRHDRQLELTEAGKIAYQTACAQYISIANMQTALEELSDRRLSLSLGMIDSVAAAVGDNVEVLERLESNTDVAMVINNSTVLTEEIMRRKLDGAFVVSSLTATPELATLSQVQELLVVVTASSEGSSPRTDLYGQTLKNFISYDAGSRTNAYILESFKSQGIRVNTTFYSTSPDVMLRLVRGGRGVAALPYSLVRESLQEGKLALVEHEGSVLCAMRPISYVARKGTQPPGVAKKFMDEIIALLEAYNEDFYRKYA